jgi:hypothetical protein
VRYNASMKQPINKPSDVLIFVYNAKSGLGNALLDTGRRYLQPKNYPCALCMITYGPFGMKNDWSLFLKTLPYPVRFLHKDEFLAEFPGTPVSFPSLMLLRNNYHTTLLTADTFKSISSLDELKNQVSKVVRV